MQIHRLDLNLLAVFECIYSQGSVTRAAEYLHLTQPSVSHALNRLRDALDDPLFVRDGRRLAPTERAQTLIQPVRAALRQIEGAVSNLDSFEPQSAELEMVIGMRPIMESAFFPEIARAFIREAPQSRLLSSQFDRDNLATELSRGDIQLALDVNLQLPKSIRRIRVAQAPIIVIGRKDHPALRKGRLTLEQYLQHEHLLVSSRRKGEGLEDLLLAREGRYRTIVSRCQQMTTALQLLDSTDLLLTVAKSLVQETVLKAYSYQTAPLNAPEVETYLYWHESTDSSKAQLWLRSLVERTFS